MLYNYRGNLQLKLFCLARLESIAWFINENILSKNIAANNHFKHSPDTKYYKREYNRVCNKIKKDKHEKIKNN